MNNKVKIMVSDAELFNNIVEMLVNGRFLQLDGKAINLTELNEFINEQQEQIEILNNIIDKAIDYMDRRDLDWGSYEHNKMMNILKGSEKE